MEQDDYSFLVDDHNDAILRAREWMKKDPLFIDTETTGLGPDAQIVDIAVVNAAGETILNTLIKPTICIPPDATAKHHITDEMVMKAPTFDVLWPFLASLLRDRVVIAYNADFDFRLMAQSATAWEPDAVREAIDNMRQCCAMKLFAQFYGAWNDYYRSYRWQRLSIAAKEAGYPEWAEHRALGDTLAARAVMLYMAGQKTEEENATNS